jgi:16S rRNA (cytidine1402-2'-O)-methyltransferase
MATYGEGVAGTLILCAGPIGNLGDAPPRLGEALAAADVVLAEDTRRARVLLGHLGVDRPLRSFFVGNEAERAGELRERLEAGQTVALVTDAGTPGIADPGLTAVRAALDVGAAVTGVPGPSAVTLAVALSGLPGDRFVFEGFLPRSGGRRARRIEALAAEERTAVFFTAPGRLAADLGDLAAVCARDRQVAVCRELTKLHEEVWRGTLADAVAAWSAGTVRGEVTVVIAGAEAPAADLESALGEVEAMIEAGTPLASAVRTVSGISGVRRRVLYEAALERFGSA